MKKILIWIISKCIKLSKVSLEEMDMIVFNTLRKEIMELRKKKEQEERENFSRFYKIMEDSWGWGLSDQIIKIDPEAIKFIKNN